MKKKSIKNILKSTVSIALTSNFLLPMGVGYAQEYIVGNQTELNSAINSAIDGDVIKFKPDTHIILTSNITLLKKNIIIDGAGNYQIFTTAGGNINGIKNITIQNFGVTTSGGAIYIGNNLVGSINNSTFANNFSRDDGGGIYIRNNLEGNINNSNFINNPFKYDGAGVDIRNNLEGDIDNTIFSH